ncbi:MAG: aldolase/citrate lyase family protein [Opitutaceae bacterium]
MKKSLIKSKFRTGVPALITGLYHPIDMFPRHAAAAGFDGIWIEAEHHLWEIREIQRMIYLCRLAGIDCLVRVATREKARLYQLLEAGATGLVIPQVSSVDEALALAEAVRFFPQGQRGLDGSGIDADFYLGADPDYPEQANQESLLFLQIENSEGLDAVEGIAAVPGVDALFIGPGDLSLRLNCNLDPALPVLREAEARIVAACVAGRIAWGRPALDETDCRYLLQADVGFVSYGSDFMAVLRTLPQWGAELRAGLAATHPASIPTTRRDG